jgi:ribosomal protein S6--L-glutamate ligase
MMGVFSANESVAISRARDKLRSLQILSKNGVGLPTTCFAHTSHSTADLIRSIGGAPLVIKILEGTHGKGVVLAETPKAAESVIDAFRGLSEHFLVQEFIEEAEGSELRLFVVGGKVIGAMMRKSDPSDLSPLPNRRRSQSIQVNVSEEESETAKRAARALGLNIAGVDILRSHKGPVVMEVNSSPSLEAIEKVSGEDLATPIIEFIEKSYLKLSTATRGEG